ncbi:MAG TPA: hypothetical protein VN381_12970 [Anaerovoracaceae bacterium]|nr:hypothetical protein [Anaerovoracaceae bacterium]
MKTKKRELKPTRPVLQPLLTFEQVNMITAFERLWVQIAHWTRALIKTYIFNLPNLNAVSDKLYSLPWNFYNILSCYFGSENSRTFIDLLLAFIYSGVRTLEGMRNEDQELVSASTKQWYKDADQLSLFLSSLNVYWDESQWKNFFYQYIQNRVEEIKAVINGDFARDNELYDFIENLTVLMGSYMARGIISISQYQYSYQKRP